MGRCPAPFWRSGVQSEDVRGGSLGLALGGGGRASVRAPSSRVVGGQNARPARSDRAHGAGRPHPLGERLAPPGKAFATFPPISSSGLLVNQWQAGERLGVGLHGRSVGGRRPGSALPLFSFRRRRQLVRSFRAISLDEMLFAYLSLRRRMLPAAFRPRLAPDSRVARTCFPLHYGVTSTVPIQHYCRNMSV